MIGQLLDMSSTPISLELKITPAKREINAESPSYNMARMAGGLNISHQYPRMNVDTSQARASLGLKSVAQSVQDYGSMSVRKATEAIQKTVDEGSRMMNDTTGGNLMGQFGTERMQSSSEVELNFLPSVPANIDWQPPQLEMRYEMDRLNFDWRTSQEPKIQFTPAKVEFLVKEYPKLEIKYLGKPIYVPPSAEPGYVPPELNITA